MSKSVSWQSWKPAQKWSYTPSFLVVSSFQRQLEITTQIGRSLSRMGVVKHIYFVAETKGSMSTMKLREIEKTKIECARKFFDEISQKISQDKVKYEVVTDYAKLMDIVGRAA